MDVWRILGIDPTDEERKIKRAYSRRIASCHPEDDPEGFQQLQHAYEQALAYARGELDLDDLDDSEFEMIADAEDAVAGVAAAPSEPKAQAAPVFQGWSRKEAFADFMPQPEPTHKEGPAVTFTDTYDLRQRSANVSDARTAGVAKPRSVRRASAGQEASSDARASRQEAAERAERRRRALEEQVAQAQEGTEHLEFVGDFIKLETQKEEKLLEKMEFHLEELEGLIESGGDLVSFFKLGIYHRYKDIDGFEERLAEMLDEYVAQMNIVEASDLEEAIGFDEDGSSPLVEVFSKRYENTSVLGFLKDAFNFFKKP